MLTLYGESLWDSPWVFSVYVALEEKGLEFETRALDLSAGEHHDPAYRDLSLTSKVPSIDHDGFVLSESAAIVEYLEEVFPAPTYARMLPAPIRERARARQIMSWLRTDLMALREARPTSSIFFDPVSSRLSDRARAAADSLIQVSERLVPDSAGPIFGDVCIADFELALTLKRLLANGDPVPPRLARFAAEVWERPSVQSFVARDRPKIH